MKTREEVDELKHRWCGDPIWDIENTEGFEEYRNTLRAYRFLMEDKWREASEKKRIERMTFQYNLEEAVEARADGWCEKSLCYSMIAVAIKLGEIADALNGRIHILNEEY